MQEINVERKIIGRKEAVLKKSYIFMKRLFDIVFSLLALVVMSPIFLTFSILIKLESPGPVIFRQERIGMNHKPFIMYKFRSMVVNAEELKHKLEKQNERIGPMFKIKNDPRVTQIGHFIRKTSIDELPQLINILKGEMSFVGPRPSLPKEVNQFEPWMLERLKVKPGLTCYWQIQGRDQIGYLDWMKLDIKYVKERSAWIDIKLICKTFFVLLGDEHAS